MTIPSQPPPGDKAASQVWPPPGDASTGSTAPPPPRGPAARWGVILVVLAVLFGGGIAIGRWALGSNTATAGGHSATSRTTTPPRVDPDTSVLSNLVLQQPDVGSTVNVQLIPNGDQVRGQTTLDLCNGTFPSEALRTARLQVAAVNGQGNAVLSTEAVLYSQPGDTAQAFSELRTVAARCPNSPVVSPVGEPAVTTHFSAAPDAAWPQVPTVERLAYSFTATAQSGQAQRSVAVYLRRGRALMGVYFPQPDGPQPTINGQTTIPGIVNVFATRLAALPASAVNGS